MVIGLLFIATQGAPIEPNDIAAAAANGDWDLFQRLISQGFNFEPNFENIKSLRPQGPDSHVYGEGEYRFHSSSNINGQKSESSGGRKVINKDGQVEEYELP
ncbi:unnamed protein product, partial [Iphiclides podalirius]